MTNLANYFKNHITHYVSHIPECCYVQDNDIAWWTDYRVTTNVCKDQHWFDKLTSVADDSMLHMGNDPSALIRGIGVINLEFTYGEFFKLYDAILLLNMRKNLVSCTSLNCLEYKQVYE